MKIWQDPMQLWQFKVFLLMSRHVILGVRPGAPEEVRVDLTEFPLMWGFPRLFEKIRFHPGSIIIFQHLSISLFLFNHRLGVDTTTKDMFVALVPDLFHFDTSLPCNYTTWLSRGWCRAELWCRLLSTRRDTSVIVIFAAREALYMFPLDWQKTLGFFLTV